MSEEKKYCVYKHTNKINGKVYIGLTGQKPEYRWKHDGEGYNGSAYFYNAIQKYGWDNFEHEILMDGLTKEEAQLREQEYIMFFKSADNEYGYNLTFGGEANIPNDATRAKMSKRMLENNPRKGYVYTDEEKKR